MPKEICVVTQSARLPSMRGRATQALLVFLTVLCGGGCTFYTACPTDNQPTPGNGGGSGGSSVGGSSAAGAPSEGPLVEGGAPSGDWTIATPAFFADIRRACGPMSYMAAKPDEDVIYVGLNAAPVLWATRDGGATYEELGTGEGSDPIDHGMSSMVFDPEDANKFWEAGSYGSHGGVYSSTDGGVTLKNVGPITHQDYVSVDFSDPERKTLLASAHETQVISLSVDGGASWEDVAGGIPEGTAVCVYPFVVDSDTFLLGCGAGGGRVGIFRSTDRGGTWERVSDHAGASAPLLASDGSIYWASESGAGLARSTDKGETWEQVITGVLEPAAPVELPDGRIASLTATHVVVSDDQGATWKIASAQLPYKPNGFIYSAFQKAFFVYYYGCGAANMRAPEDAIMRFDFDYEAP